MNFWLKTMNFSFAPKPIWDLVIFKTKILQEKHGFFIKLTILQNQAFLQNQACFKMWNVDTFPHIYYNYQFLLLTSSCSSCFVSLIECSKCLYHPNIVLQSYLKRVFNSTKQTKPKLLWAKHQLGQGKWQNYIFFKFMSHYPQEERVI